MNIFHALRRMRDSRARNDAIVNAIYARIVAAARQPAFYADCNVPDTPLGRFEMISVHMGLLLNAARNGGSAQTQLVQAITEEFFRDVDHSLRELGIGDAGIPKRMKKLASMFYGRVDGLRTGLDEGDDTAFGATLARNIWPEAPDSRQPDAARMVPHLRAVHAAMASQMPSPLIDGQLDLPAFERAMP